MNPTIDLILSHRSIRQFTPEPVSAEQLDQILSAAQSAASSSFPGQQHHPGHRQGLRATLAELAGHQAYVVEAAEFLVFCADYHRHSQIVPEARTGFVEQLMIGAIDGALMAQNALLAAQSLGLGGLYRRHSQQSGRGERGAGSAPSGDPAVWPLPGSSRPAAGAKPQLPRALVVHENRYPATLDRALLARYDGQIHDYYQARSSNNKDQTWSGQIRDPGQGGEAPCWDSCSRRVLPQVMGRRAIWSMTHRMRSPPGSVLVRQYGIWALPMRLSCCRISQLIGTGV